MMYHQVLSWMYERPMWLYWGLLGAVIVLWAVLGFVCRQRRAWVTCNAVFSGMAAVAIMAITLLLRTTHQQGVVLSFTELLESAKIYPDVYIQMQLNAVLFVPLGLTLPYALSNKKCPVLWTMVTAAVLSIGIETAQYVFSKGYSELADVALNLAGAFLGTLAWLLTKQIANIYQKKEGCPP